MPIKDPDSIASSSVYFCCSLQLTMKWGNVFGFLLAVATAYGNALQQTTVAKNIQERSTPYDYNDYGPPMPYSFRYAVYNPLYHNNFGHEESNDGRVTTGKYFVSLPDGRLQTVAYKDEGLGFMAQVHYDGDAKYPPGPGYGALRGPYLHQNVPKLSEAQVAAIMEIMVEAAEKQTAHEVAKEHHEVVTLSPIEPITTTEAIVASEPIVPVEGLEPVTVGDIEPEVVTDTTVPVEGLEPIVSTEPAVEPPVTIATLDAAEEDTTEPAAELDLGEAEDPAIYHPRQLYRDIYAKYRRPAPYADASPYGPYDRYAKYRVPYPAEYESPYSPYGPYDQYAKYRQYTYPGKYRQAYTTYNGEVYAARPKRKHPKRSKRKQQARQAKAGRVALASIKRVDEEVDDYEDDFSDTEILKL